MYNIEKIKRNICLELRQLREDLDDDQYQEVINNQKLVINFENNEVYRMEKNSYLNPQDENINNIKYFKIPSHWEIDSLLNNDDNLLSRAIEKYYKYEYNIDKSELEDSFDFER